VAEIDVAAAAIAEAYAQALLELTEAHQRSEQVLAEFNELVAYMRQDEDFARFMTSEMVELQARRATLEKLFRGRMDDLLLNALLVLNAKRRLDLIEQVRDRYEVLLERVRGQERVSVTTAVPLGPDLRERLAGALAEITGRRPVLIEKVDPEILGGLVVEVGDRRVDASILQDLRRRRESIRQRASQEIHSGKDYFEAAG